MLDSTQLLAALKDVCRHPEVADPTFGPHFTENPFKLNGWACATDGRVLLGLKPGVLNCLGLAEPPPTSEAIWGLMQGRFGDVVRVEFTPFREWFLEGFVEPAPFRLCDKCKGHGETRCKACDHASDCEDCGGQGRFGGWGRYRVRLGQLLGQAFNRELLAKAMRKLEAGTVELGLAEMQPKTDRYNEHAHDGVFIESKAWRCVVMPMSVDTEEWAGAAPCPAALGAEVAVSQPVPNCTACDGCGQVADDEDRTPWTAWATLPRGADIAVRTGLVKPVRCEACAGTGKAVANV